MIATWDHWRDCHPGEQSFEQEEKWITQFLIKNESIANQLLNCSPSAVAGHDTTPSLIRGPGRNDGDSLFQEFSLKYLLELDTPCEQW